MARRLHYKFQTFVDLATSTESMQLIQWSVGGKEVINRCRHLFGAFKYFKLGKISIKLVPASTLPVDPQGLSYDVDDPYTVDPVDQMNMGLVRITNGEDVFTNISSLSDAQQDRAYKTMLLDPRWSKFSLQSGFRRSAYPMYWQVGQLCQDKYPGSTINVPSDAQYQTDAIHAKHLFDSGVPSDDLDVRTNMGSSARGLFQTGMRGRLGFLPTDYYQLVPNGDSEGRFVTDYGLNNVPQVRVITCILPKASKTVYYYRCYITEYVTFAGIRSSIPYYPEDGQNYPQGNVGVDNFLVGSFTYVNSGVSIPDVSSNPASKIFNNGGDQLP